MNNQPILSGSTIFLPTQFPLRIMRVPSHGVSPGQHQHDFTELVVILDGVGKHEVGSELYSIKAGDVFVLLGGMSHAYREVDNLYLVNILLDLPQLGVPLADLGGLPGYHALFEVEPQMRRRGQFQNRLRLSAEQLATVAALIAEIELELELEAGRRGGQFLAIAHLMRLIGYLSRCYSQGQPDDSRPITQISRLLGYLERHYAEPIAIDDMLAVAHLSQSTLMRTFRQVLGRSPVDHLIRLRVGKAQELLRRTSLSIGEIAREVGFCDGNYLARQFRRVTGVSPLAWRRNLHQAGK